MTVTRNSLRKDLQEKGFSYREARKIVTAICKVMVDGLKKTGKLELPFGDLTLHQPTPKRQIKFNKIVITYKKPKVRFRRKNDSNSG